MSEYSGNFVKSFYLSVDGAPATKNEKKKYPDQVLEALGSCEEIMNMNLPWRDLAKVIYKYENEYN